jgi:hypothetical protein
MTPDFQDAAKYALLRQLEVRMPIGSTQEYLSKAQGLVPFKTCNVTKYSGRVDPTARPIVVAIDRPDSWLVEESPNGQGEWRIARNIPPAMLSVIRLKDEVEYWERDVDALANVTAALRGINQGEGARRILAALVQEPQARSARTF